MQQTRLLSSSERAGSYEPLDWVLVRTPLLPLERYLELCGDDLEAIVTRALREPAVRRAIAVASPSLFTQLGRAGSEFAPTRRGSRAVLRYLIRMSTRCTPYGLNAAVSLAGWGEKTNLELGDGEDVRARLDMGLIDSLIGQLEDRLEVVRSLRLRTHPLVIVRGGRAFLPERFSGDTGAFEVSVRASGPVRMVLEWCRRSPVAFSRLRATLEREFPTAGTERIEALIHGLLREGLLTSELHPPLTRGDPAAHLLAVLAPIAAARPERERLAAAVAACERWERREVALAADEFASVLTDVAALAPPAPGVPPVRVDMCRGLEGALITREVATESARAVELLLRLSSLPAGQTSLNIYRDRFLERYAPQTEVPLLELLDPDLGLGPLDLRADTAPGGLLDDDARRRDRARLRLAAAALRDGSLVVELDERTLAQIALDPGAVRDRMPISAELSAFVDAESRDALDAGEFTIVISPMLGSHSAGRILGRFAYLFGDSGQRSLRDAARGEQLADERHVRAELVYAPERPWLTNVMLRPGSRGYELVVGAAPGVDPDHVIALDELVVGVIGDTFYLRWPRRSAYVEVCESHMLNPKTAPAVGAFLALMRHAGRPIMTGFSWGSARELPRLPRVQSGRIVLSPATWRPSFSEPELAAREPFAAALRRWRQDWSMPRRVFAAQGDHRLLVDLDDPDQVDLIRGLINSPADETHVVLQEALPGVDSGWLSGPGGRYLVELAVPVVLRARHGATERELERPQRPPAERAAPAARSQRVRGPGSDWLYAKLYTGGIVGERLIGTDLRAFAQDALDVGLAHDWFFVRLRDPRPHLRVRLRGDPETLSRELAPRLYRWVAELTGDGACESLVIDTYTRETERYGGVVAIELAEAVFGVDSRLVAELIALDVAGGVGISRELLSVLSLDRLLCGLGLDLDERRRWCAARTGLRHEVATEWREHKQLLRVMLGGPGALASGEPLVGLLDTFVATLRPVGAELAARRRAGLIRWPDEDYVIASFAHMHCNRLLGLDRGAERRALGLLDRTLDSLARAPIG